MKVAIQAAGGASVATGPSVADLIVKGIVEGIRNGFFDYIDTNFFDAYPGILYVQTESLAVSCP